MTSLIRLALCAVLLAAALLSVCCPRASAAVRAPARSRSTSRPIRFASFNIQVFGRKKASDQAVMDTLVRILRRYDVVVIMEIRDSSGEAFPELVRQTNIGLGGDPFEYVISERTGRTVSKEQYSVMYRPSVARVLAERTVADPGDRFQREPYLVKLRLLGRAELSLLCLHTEPERTVEELDALYDTAQPLRDDGLLIAGDLNADCAYVSRTKMSTLRLRRDTGYHWLIGDGVDTTVKSTDCAYDRLIVSRSALSLVSNPRVFHFDKQFGLSATDAAKVSDHYPVELDLM